MYLIVIANKTNKQICGAGVEPSPLLLWPLVGLLYQPWMVYGDGFEATDGMNG
jgi:hypothetical protein